MTKTQRNMARAGYLLGAALGIIRFAGTQTIQDLMLATSLLLVELATVWLVEKKAGQWEADQDKWRGKETLRGQQQSQAQSTADELAWRQRLLDGTKQEMKEIDDACRHDHLMSDLKALISIAINAVRSGYYTGIAHNVGILGGSWRKVT